MILDRSQVEKNIARINSGGEKGTAFLISDNVAVTAKHILDGNNDEVILEFLNVDASIIMIEANVINIESLDFTVDVVFLKLKTPLSGFEHLAFEDKIVSFRANWNTFAYPAIEHTHGLPISGTVDQIKTLYNPYDYDMILRYDGEPFNSDGVSGSPVIIDGTVRGIITDDKAGVNLLGAISTEIFTKMLEPLGISLYDNDQSTLDNQSMRNDTIISINSSVKENDSGCIFVKGVPGSGKTSLAESLSDDAIDAKIIGRYFVDNKNDDYSIQYKSSPVVFAKWLINCVSKELYGTLVEEKDYESHTLTELVIKYLGNLSSEGIKNDRRYVFILDGFDETYRINEAYLSEIFGLFPTDFKRKIIFLILGNNESIYPDYIKNSMVNIGIILMRPFSEEQVIEYLETKLSYYNPEYAILKNLARKSEGNPLYIHYIIEFITSNSKDEILDVLDDLPDFNGEIENYYKRIWESIRSESKYVKVISVLARIRGTVSKSILIKMMDEDTKLVFDEVLDKLKHLLIENNEIRIYHNSFANFIIFSTEHINIQMQRIIADYSLANNDKYSIENKLYHLVRSDDIKINQAIKLCNQEWIDELALNNVNPDLILIDAKEVLNKAVDLINIPEIVRILLLIQRLKFRNEKVFRQYAFEMSKALLEIGKRKESLQYIIREETLIISLGEALYMLRRYLQEDETENAEILVKAIQNRCIKDYQDNSIPFTTIFADISSTALFPEYNFKKRYMLFAKMLSEHSPGDFPEIMADISANVSGYVMWNRNHYTSLTQMEENFGELTDAFVDIQLKLIQAYLMFESQFYRKDSETLISAVNDLEELCKRFQITKNDDVALVLMKFGSDSELIKELLENIDERKFEIRAKNGVDLDFNSLNEYFNYCMMKSYLASDITDIVVIYGEWESFIQSIVECIACLAGLCWKSRHENDNDLLNSVISKLIEVMSDINISLEERASWDRSYALPEHLIPFVWTEIADLFTRFSKENLDSLIAYVIKNEQLGIYSEGYRRVLFNIIDLIINDKDLSPKAFLLLDKLEHITDEFVENRWEKTRDYLRIIERYGKIGSYEKANNVYIKMLDTSMGPSWYKEAQMKLMGSCFQELINLPNKANYVINTLADLDYSSGEMTFQRYVRDEKEEFIGIICKVLGLESAISYFKFLSFPNPKDLLDNAQHSSMDVLKDGYGYVQGTKEIDLQDGMLSLIGNVHGVSNDLIWALTEIFIQGDDRYFPEYSGLQLKIIVESLKSSKILYNEFSKRVERQFVSEFDNTRRNYYIRELEYRKELDGLANIHSSLSDLNIVDKVDFSTKYSRYKDDLDAQTSEEEVNGILKLVDQEMTIGNKRKAKELLAHELLKVSDRGISVFNYSQLTNKYVELLKELAESPNELVELLGNIFKNPYGQLEWDLVDDMLELIGPKLNEEESISVVNIVIKHFGYLLRTPEYMKKKYEWIRSVEKSSRDNDSLIFEFILWLSSLPGGLLIKQRVFDVVLWLSNFDANKYVPLLVRNALIAGHSEIMEVCCGILHNLSQSNNVESVCYCIYNNEESKTQILESNNFMILSTFYEIFKKANRIGLIGIDDFYNSISAKLFRDDKTFNRKGKISLECGWLGQAKPYLDRLNVIVALDSDFLNQLSLKIKNLISPLTLPDIIRVQHYIERSYSLPRGISNYYNSIILSGVNELIGKYVTKSNYNEIIGLLRQYNPKSPELNLEKSRPSIFDKVTRIFKENSNDYNQCCEYNGRIILHFHEAVENVEAKMFDRLEIVAYFVDEFSPEKVFRSKLYDDFKVNIDPYEVKLVKSQSHIIPLILKSKLAFVYGSMYTPSEIHPDIVATIDNFDEDDILQSTWRDGRVLDVYRFGMPKSEGSCLLISKEALNKVNDNKTLMYRITFNEKVVFLDYDNKRIY